MGHRPPHTPEISADRVLDRDGHRRGGFARAPAGGPRALDPAVSQVEGSPPLLELIADATGSEVTPSSTPPPPRLQ
jgi:hypothetical protein